MSFSSLVKEELTQIEHEKACCTLAELAGIIRMAGTIEIQNRGLTLRIDTESATTARRIYNMLKKCYHVRSELESHESQRLGHKTSYCQRVMDTAKARHIMEDVGIFYSDDVEDITEVTAIPEKFVANDCCRRAFLRGAFLAAGTMSHPERSYHLEIVAHDEGLANHMRRMLVSYGIRAHVMHRRDTYVLYLKGSDCIADMLTLIGAHTALLEMENIRILKSMKNNANRVTNCDTANMDKTTNASARQAACIEYIERCGKFPTLTKELRAVAEIRLEYREASLQELADMLPGVSRSGVNHRLRRLVAIAEELRRENGDVVIEDGKESAQ